MDTSPAAVAHKSFRVWLLLGGVLAALGVTLALAQWRDYQSVRHSAREQLLTHARTADELVTLQIQSADAALRSMIASMESGRVPNGYLPLDHERLQQLVNMMPGTRTFAVMDRNGICQASNRTTLLGQDFSGREYFKQAAADKDGRWLHIPPPYQTSLKIWTVTVSRAVIRPNGQFGGVVVATLSPDYFESVMKELQYAADMRVTLVHDQGAIYASLPPNLAQMSPVWLTKGAFFHEHMQAGVPETDHLGPGLDDINRMGVGRTVALGDDLQASHNFVVIASRKVDAVFARWRITTVVVLAIWLTISALSAAALMRYQRGAARLIAKTAVAERALRLSEKRYEQMAGTLPCLLFDFEVTASGGMRVTYVGPYSQTLVGIAPEVLMGDYPQYMQRIHEDDRPTFQAVLDEAVTTGQGYECEYRYHMPNGELRWLRTVATPGAPTPGGRVTHFSGFVVDITDTKNQQLQLREMAYHDPLTQADNRRSFLEKLQAEIARVQRYGELASLLMLDIDFFKQVNDTYGHQTGDAVLKHLVAVLQTGLRGVDSLGRLGGEEFAVLLPGTGLDAAMQLAGRLRQAVQASPAIEGGQTVSFTISIGVVAITADTSDMQATLHLADKAMYHAKQTGRNRVCDASEAPDTTLQGAFD